MSLKVKVKNETEYPPIPEGTYTAICYTIADLGQQYSDKFKKSTNKILFIWEIVDDDLRIEYEGDMQRRVISKKYSASFSPKSNMYKDLRPWIGREFTQEEMDGTFDVGSLIGTGCILNIVNDTTPEGKTYSNVASVMQLPKGMKTGKPENPIVLYDMDDSPEETLEMLPEWVRNVIAKSQNASMKQANSVSVKVDADTGEVIEDIDDGMPF